MKNIINIQTVLFFAFSTLLLRCINRNSDCRVSMQLDKYDKQFNFFSRIDTSDLNRDKYIVVEIDDCKGDLSIKEFISKSNALVFEGFYIIGRDTTVIGERPIDPAKPNIFVLDTSQYYIPIRDGIWKYYNNSGELIRREKYKRGKLLEEIVY